MKLKEFIEKRDALKEKLKNAKDEELEEIRSEIAELEKAQIEDDESEPKDENKGKLDERSLLRSSIDKLDFANANIIKKPEKEKRDMDKDFIEKQAIALRSGKAIKVAIPEQEKRSITVSSGTILVPTKYKKEVADSYDTYSALVDKVHQVPLDGGESYDVAFEKSVGEGGYTVEGGEYKETEPEYGHAPTGRAKITAYAEVSEEVEKLPDVDYVSRISDSVTKALKKKIGAQIVAGTGTTNTIHGIYNADTNVVDGKGDISISKIDAETLNKIVFGFGGDEETELGQTLILNKKDLKEFADVKNDKGDFVYKIVRNGKEGKLSYANGSAEVSYIINSACNALSDSATADKSKTMIYGSLEEGYELPVFSNIDVQMSNDYKFKEGMKAFKGSVFVGGTVSKYNAFSRIIKAATV